VADQQPHQVADQQLSARNSYKIAIKPLISRMRNLHQESLPQAALITLYL
jgi:hypothetical protein